METQRQTYPVQVLAAVLGVSRSGYYAWRHRRPSARAQANTALLVAIRKAHAQSRGTYGSPRIWRKIRATHPCGRHRVARLMRQAQLQGLPQRRFHCTTQRSGTRLDVPDRLERDFMAATPNCKWVSDITYIPTAEGWLYLAVILDLYSRLVVGWAMGTELTADLVLTALEMAAARRPLPEGLIYHSDHGTQYTSAAVQAWLTQHGLLASLGSVGDCYDNAVAESFFSTLKRECVHRHPFQTRKEARTVIFEYIEVFYNRERLHSTLGYLSPAAFEAANIP